MYLYIMKYSNKTILIPKSLLFIRLFRLRYKKYKNYFVILKMFIPCIRYVNNNVSFKFNFQLLTSLLVVLLSYLFCVIGM